MTGAREVLLFHAAKYPQMQLQDAVKLLYQRAFAGGHMIASKEAALAYLIEEYRAVGGYCESEAAEVPIGRGLVRANIRAIKDEAALAALFERFVHTANTHTGNRAAFSASLDVLYALCVEGLLPFSPQEAGAFLADYRAANCPALHHSDIYREAYKPAYRVVFSQ